MKKSLFYLLLMNLFGLLANAQTGVNTGNTTPTKTLDVNGELRVRTIPVVTTGDVLVADVNGNVVKVSNYLIDNAPVAGDVKKGFQTADHQGWYLLDGRNITTLPSNAQTNASNLGFATTLPDARGKFLKISTNPATVATTAGSNSPVLTQANLPNFNFTGSTTSSASATHSHTGTDNYTTFSAGTRVPTTTGSPRLNPTNDVTRTTSTSGAHSHTGTVSSGGSSTPIVNAPQYIIVNVFIYLGQ